jgi:integrase/recombinase XerC
MMRQKQPMKEKLELSFVAPAVAAELGGWLAHLGGERNYSPKTVEAYRRDVVQFLGFLAEHLGGSPSLKAFAGLAPADVRAFLAARRAEGVGSRSLMRTLAGLRGFARYLERAGKGKTGALTAVRGPKIGKTLPRPLPAASAKRLADPAWRTQMPSRGSRRATPRCWRCSTAAGCAFPKRLGCRAPISRG